VCSINGHPANCQECCVAYCCLLVVMINRQEHQYIPVKRLSWRACFVAAPGIDDPLMLGVRGLDFWTKDENRRQYSML
jgi:hypothetical protein